MSRGKPWVNFGTGAIIFSPAFKFPLQSSKVESHDYKGYPTNSPIWTLDARSIIQGVSGTKMQSSHLDRPCEVVNLLDIQAPCVAATQCHGDENTVVDRWAWPAAHLQGFFVLKK